MNIWQHIYNDRSLTGQHDLPLAHWLQWSSSLSLAPMVFLSLLGSHGLPLALAPMVFLSLICSHGLPLSHWLPWSSSRSLARMVFLSRWPTWSSSRSLAPMVFLSLTAPMVFRAFLVWKCYFWISQILLILTMLSFFNWIMPHREVSVDRS